MARRKVSYRRKSLGLMQKLMLCALVVLVFGVFVTVVLVMSPQAYKSNAAWDVSACAPGPRQGQAATMIPGTDGNYKEEYSDPYRFFGILYDSKDISDPYFTAGRANVEGRWAGSSEYRAAFCHFRGCAYTRADKPGYPQVIGGWLYDPAYDWPRFDNGSYKNNDLVWDRLMDYTDRELAKYDDGSENASIFTKVNRNCLIGKVIENMINDGWPIETAVSRQPFQPVYSGGPSTIKIYAAGDKGNNFPTMTLTINNIFAKEWKTIQGNNDARQFLEFTYTHPTKIVPGQVVVSMNSGDCNDDNPGQCQALHIDKINIDGVDYQTEDPSVFNSAQWDSAHGCTPAFGNPYPATETLGCKGYVRFAGSTGGEGGPQNPGGVVPTQAPQQPQITLPPTFTPVPTLPSPVTPVTAARSMIVAAGFIGLITMGFIVFGL